MPRNGDWRQRIAAFETATLLRAVDDLDSMRDHLDGDGHQPPEIRDDLLRLHRLAMAVVEDAARDRSTIDAMFDLALDIEGRVDELTEALERMREALAALVVLAPGD